MAGLTVAGVMAPATPAMPGDACMSFHGEVFLKDFAGGPPVNDVPGTFYVGVEGQSFAATVAPMPGCGDINEGGSSTASYTTENVTASAGPDYTHTQGTTDPMCDDIDSWEQYCEGVPRSRAIDVPLLADGTEDDLSVETFLIRLTSGSRGISRGHPNPVPAYVIDADGPARASLEPGASTKVYPHIEAGRIRLPVFLAGANPPSSVGFTVLGEGSNAGSPGDDFTCTPVCPGGIGNLSIDASATNFVQINFNRDEEFEGVEHVRLSITGPAVAPGEPESTVIEILDLNKDETAPMTRFLQPKNGVKYKWRDKRLRELKAKANDDGVGTIAKVEVALQKRMRNGKCASWKGTKFGAAGKNCGAKKWLPMTHRPAADLYFLKLKPLAATVGTKIKNYTAWTRATDSVGNMESTFTRVRNLSTFHIKKKR
jgi:hypothetical protein